MLTAQGVAVNSDKLSEMCGLLSPYSLMTLLQLSALSMGQKTKGDEEESSGALFINL